VTLRTRLFAAIVLVVVGVLGVSSVATYVLVKRSIADNALDDLRKRSTALADQGTQLQAALNLKPVDRRLTLQQQKRRAAAREAVRRALDVSDFNVVFVAADGTIATGDRLADPDDVIGLPPSLSPDDLDSARLLAGQEVSGTKGDLVYLAKPLGTVRGFTTIVVATDSINTNVLSDAQPWLLAVAAGAFVVAALLAALVARTLTRPISRIEETARILATGDLSARADTGRGTDHELAALAATLNTMAQQLDEARGAERAFLLSVSHDLRTPLTSIRGYAEALSDGTIDGGDPEARARAASVITAEARRLERLVRDLLDLSRLDSHQFSLSPRPCDAVSVVRDAAEAFAPAARDLGLTLAVVAPASLTTDLDPERLGQIVANLVENALKFATTTVRVSLKATGLAFEVAVTDDGPGVAPDDLGRVFERLYTVRSTPGRSVGTGLGLAIVHELAQAMGGSARAEAPASGGSRFVVTLPLGAAAVAN
jgi:two-component system sensor histidine kinase BaeS